MNGSAEVSCGNSTLVIGIHREELGFGLKVAEQVEPFIRILRIDNGLTHEKALYRSGFYHSTVHREMYMQLHQQLKGKTDFVIDLHTGINETGRCADILCADVDLLRNLASLLESVNEHPLSPPGEERLYRISEPDAYAPGSKSMFAESHTIIPRQVWNGDAYMYAGLEIYLPEPGDGSGEDSEYAAQLIRMLCQAKNGTTRSTTH